MPKADRKHGECPAQMKSSKLDEKLPRLLEGRFLKDNKTGKRIHVDRYQGSTASGHFNVTCHLVGSDDPWSLDSRRPPSTDSMINQSCDASDIDAPSQVDMGMRANASENHGHSKSLGGFMVEKDQQGEITKESNNRRSSNPSQGEGVDHRSSFLSHEDRGGSSCRECVLSQENGDFMKSQTNRGTSCHESLLSRAVGNGSHRKHVSSQKEGGNSHRKSWGTSFQKEDPNITQNWPSEIRELEVAARPQREESTTLEHETVADEDAQAHMQHSKRKPTGYPRNLPRESQDPSEMESSPSDDDQAERGSRVAGDKSMEVEERQARTSSQRSAKRSSRRISKRSSAVTSTSCREGRISASGNVRGQTATERLSCGTQSSLACGEEGVDSKMSTCQDDLAPSPKDSKVACSAVSYISSDDDQMSICQVDLASTTEQSNIRRSTKNYISSGDTEYYKNDTVQVEKGNPSCRQSSLKHPSQVWQSSQVSASPRPSHIESCGAESEHHAGRRSAASQVSSNGMTSMQIKDGSTCMADMRFSDISDRQSMVKQRSSHLEEQCRAEHDYHHVGRQPVASEARSEGVASAPYGGYQQCVIDQMSPGFSNQQPVSKRSSHKSHAGRRSAASHVSSDGMPSREFEGSQPWMADRMSEVQFSDGQPVVKQSSYMEEQRGYAPKHHAMRQSAASQVSSDGMASAAQFNSLMLDERLHAEQPVVKRPSQLLDQCGHESERQAGRQSAASQVSSEPCMADRMSETRFSNGEPVITQSSQLVEQFGYEHEHQAGRRSAASHVSGDGMPSGQFEGSQPCLADRVSEVQFSDVQPVVKQSSYLEEQCGYDPKYHAMRQSAASEVSSEGMASAQCQGGQQCGIDQMSEGFSNRQPVAKRSSHKSHAGRRSAASQVSSNHMASAQFNISQPRTTDLMPDEGSYAEQPIVKRPSQLLEQSGHEYERQAGRQSAASQVSSDGMASTRMNDRIPEVQFSGRQQIVKGSSHLEESCRVEGLSHAGRQSAASQVSSEGMVTAQIEGSQPYPIDGMPEVRLSNGQPVTKDTTRPIRSSEGRASAGSERTNTPRQPQASDRNRYSELPSTIWETSQEKSGSTSRPSEQLSESVSDLQDIQGFQFQDIDGRVICLKREDSDVNLYVNGVLEAARILSFTIDMRKREYTAFDLSSGFQLNEDVERLVELRDALFKSETEGLRAICDTPVGDEAQGDGANHESNDKYVDEDSKVATCEDCTQQLESEHKSISDDESGGKRYSRAACRFTRRSTSTFVGLTQLPLLHAPFASLPQMHDISGTECSRVKLLLEKVEHVASNRESPIAFADLPELLKSLGDAVTVHVRSILEVDDNCSISTLQGVPVALLMLVKLVEVLDLIIPSEVAASKYQDTKGAVPATVVWSGEMLNALRQGLSSTGFLPTCRDLLAGRYRQALQERNASELAGELELHALLAVRLALSWIPPPHIQGPCGTFCAIEGHKTLIMLAADLLNLVRTKSAGHLSPEMPPTTAKEGHDCIAQLALVLESLLCGVRCGSSFMTFAYGQDQGHNSNRCANGVSRNVYGSAVIPVAPMALDALEVVSVLHTPGLERNRGAAVDAAATAALNLLAQLAEGPINTTVVPANSISTAVCYLLASKPLTVRLAAALRALICRPSHQPGWFVGKRKAAFDSELRTAFNAADLSIDLVHSTQKALAMGKDQEFAGRDSWEEEAAVLKECTSKVCDLYGHVQAIIMQLNRNKPEELAELQKSLPRLECCEGESPLASTCESDSQCTPAQGSVLGRLQSFRSQIRHSWCPAPFLWY